MTTRRRRDTLHQRYVESHARAEIAALEAAAAKVAQEPTLTVEAPPAPCMERFERFGAVCPDAASCAETGVCARVAWRASVTLVARSAVLRASAL